MDNLRFSRDISIDLLRVIGLVAIILAHTNPPDLIFQLRSFDVPLFVIVSGLSYGLSMQNKEISYWLYLKKRLPRLIVPTWTFLIVFFVATFILFNCFGKNYPFSARMIERSFALFNENSIGYVWIIKVFLLVMLIAPICYKVNNKMSNHFSYLILLVAVYAAYELFYFIYSKIYYLPNFVIFILNEYLFYIISYSCLFGLGLRMLLFRKKMVLLISILSLISFLICTFYLSLDSKEYFVSTFKYKYPPRFYFVSYGIFVSSLLYLLLDGMLLKKYSTKIIVFLSSSTIWIYLWHILILYLWGWAYSYIPFWCNNFMIKFCIIFCVSICITFLQKYSINKLINHSKISTFRKYFLEVAFLK